jgi:hypothetical protein
LRADAFGAGRWQIQTFLSRGQPFNCKRSLKYKKWG